MRPKKTVLVVGEGMGVIRYVLGTRPYWVVSATDPLEALGLFAKASVDLAIIDFALPEMSGAELAEKLKQLDPCVPILLFTSSENTSAPYADAIVKKKGVVMADVLERIRIMTARKRGPKKGRPIRSSPPAMASHLLAHMSQ